MEVQRCIDGDHENLNKVVEGICIDRKCYAKQKLWCDICLRKYHHNCAQDQQLSKIQYVEKLVALQKRLQMKQEESALYRFLTLKEEIQAFMNQLENSLFKNQDQQTQNMINKIEKFIQNPFAPDLLNESLQVLENEFVPPVILGQDDILKELNKISKSFCQLQNVAHVTSLVPHQKQTDNSKWFLKNNQEHLFKMPQLINSLDCSPDGKHIVCAVRKIIRIYDPMIKNQVGLPMIGHSDDVYTVKYCPFGKFIASGGNDFTLRVWNANTQEQLQLSAKDPNNINHFGTVCSVAFSPHGLNLASVGKDKLIKIWNIEQQDIGLCLTYGFQLQGHTNVINSVRYTQDGRFVISGSQDLTLKVWDLNNRTCFRTLDRFINNFEISLDGPFMIWRQITSKHPSTKYFNFDKEILQSVYENAKSQIGNNNLEQQNQFAKQGQVQISQQKNTIQGQGFNIKCSFDDLKENDGTIRLWNIESDCEVHERLLVQAFPILKFALSPDQKLMALLTEALAICIMEVQTGKNIGHLDVTQIQQINSIQFSPDGKFLILNQGSMLRILTIQMIIDKN